WLCNLAEKTWHEFILPTHYAESLSFTPDGKWLTAVSANSVLVIETATLKETFRKEVTGYRPHYASLSPHGILLAILPTGFIHGPEREVRLVSVPYDDEIARVNLQTRTGRWVEFSHDGKNIFVGDHFGIREWNPMTGKLVREIEGPAEVPIVYSSNKAKM